MNSFIAVAWNNGQHNASGDGYGLKISASDRDTYFRREWRVVTLRLKGREHLAIVNIEKESFWNDTCRELISKQIGGWLIENGCAPWPPRNPPNVRIKSIAEGEFECEVI